MKTIELNTPLIDKVIAGLKAGNKVLFSGNLLVARDQVHMKLRDLIEAKKGLPVDLNGQAIYYSGPSPARPGEIIGAIGPTTASRMDEITEPLLKKGLKMTIGKGERSSAFQELVQKYQAPYLVAMGGGGAVMQESVEWAKVLAFDELGPDEALINLSVHQMPLYVAYDIHGGSIYK